MAERRNLTWGDSLKKYAAIFVALGAISYGIPGVLFKMARHDGVSDGMLLVLTFFIGCFVLNLASAFLKPEDRKVGGAKKTFGVVASGSSIALTNTFYLLSMAYIPVAVGAVMMMQSVWLAILFSCIRQKRLPSLGQVISVGLILIGTVLATGLLPIEKQINLTGLLLAFMAALAYALTIQFTGNVGTGLQPLNKARLMSLGAFLLIFVIWGHTLFQPQNMAISFKWGGITAFFAMIFPLTAFSFCMPKLAMGVGPILSAMELPSSVIAAFLLLQESVTALQIVGVALIIFAVVLSNLAPLISQRQYQKMQASSIKIVHHTKTTSK